MNNLLHNLTLCLLGIAIIFNTLSIRNLLKMMEIRNRTERMNREIKN